MSSTLCSRAPSPQRPTPNAQHLTPRPFRFCPYCATALEPRLVEQRVWPGCPSCGFVAASGQRLAAGAVVELDGGVLLLQRRRPPVGVWELPGGWVERGESPWDAAVREVREEAGLALSDGVLLGVFTDERATTVCFHARAAAGPVAVSGEHTEARVYSRGAIPWDRLRTENHRAALEAWLRAAPVVVALVGHSGSGKTTLMEGLIRELSGRGLRVAAIKHDPKGHAVYDQPGKDSWRYRQAGAAAVALAGPATVATFRQAEGERRLLDLARQLAAAEPVDLVLAEGYHTQAGFPKIEVYRPALGRPPRCTAAELVAVATDAPAPVPGLGGLPHLPLNDPVAVVQFLLRTVLDR